jgi:hypothetical protein
MGTLLVRDPAAPATALPAEGHMHHTPSG